MNDIKCNLDVISELVGTVVGLSDGLEEDQYMEDLLHRAHSDASAQFDLAAAAAASAGYLTHVYEFGTAGITRGPVKFPDPTSVTARLWVHQMTGRGGTQEIGYAFRPAMAPNPQPTTAYTGVPSKYLRKLSRRKYVFTNKAIIMETGATITIKSKNGGLLFVPFYGEPSRNPLNKRGFMMYPFGAQGIKSTPGRQTKGQFTKFWLGWWGSTGQNIIAKRMEQDVKTDVARAIEESRARAAKINVKPIAANKPSRAASSAKVKAKRSIVAKARARRGKKRR